jgi:ribose 5-phosphate isomerase B
MRVIIGNDHVGLELKNKLDQYFKLRDIEIVHLGTFSEERMNYPEIAFKLSESVINDDFDTGILICGTGLGMSIAANKVNGIRAVAVSEPYSAKMSREHNDANILCLGSRVIGTDLAEMILDNWFKTKYLNDRHEVRINMINKYGE